MRRVEIASIINLGISAVSQSRGPACQLEFNIMASRRKRPRLTSIAGHGD